MDLPNEATTAEHPTLVTQMGSVIENWRANRTYPSLDTFVQDMEITSTGQNRRVNWIYDCSYQEAETIPAPHRLDHRNAPRLVASRPIASVHDT